MYDLGEDGEGLVFIKSVELKELVQTLSRNFRGCAPVESSALRLAGCCDAQCVPCCGAECMRLPQC